MAERAKMKMTVAKIAACILALVCILLLVIFKGYETIPKGVNEVLFVWTAIGIFLLLRHRKDLKDQAYLYIALIVIAFMSFWRMFFLNISSRYSFGLILPFAVIASSFLLDGLRKRRRRLIRLALLAAIIGSTVCMVWMNFNGLTRNQHDDVVGEIFSGIDSTKGNHVFTVQKENFFRIGVIGGLDRTRMEAMDYKMTLDEYLADYSRVYPETLVNIATKEPDVEPGKNGFRITKIVSMTENKKKPKYRLIYSIVPDSANCCVPISASQIAPYPANLLENGDFELADSPEESAEKFELHVPEGAMTASEEFRTPRNACFSAEPPEKSKTEALLEIRWDWVRKLINFPQQRLPECGMVSGADAIAGNSSARIQAPDAPARLMFDRKLPDGSYECTLLVRGSKGTEITVMYDVYRNGERKTVPVATARLTDKRPFRITARFSVEATAAHNDSDLLSDEDQIRLPQDLLPSGEGDWFQFGVEVVKGEACLDNVTLTGLDD